MDWASLHWPGGVPLWLLALLGLVLAESLRRRIPFLRERLSPGRTSALLAVRALLYLLILFFLSGPTLVERRERTLPARLLVLVDSSASMGVKDGPGGGSRLAEAVEVLLGGEGADEKGGKAAPGREEKGESPKGGKEAKGKEGKDKEAGAWRGLLGRLSRSYDIRLRRFDLSSAPLTREDLLHLKAGGPGSESLGAIRAALERKGDSSEPERLSGILLLSDGGDTTRALWPPEDAARFPPVVGIGFGRPQRFRDISLHEVRAPRIAFREKEVRLEVTLTVRGFTGQKLPVALTRGGRVIRTLTVDVRNDPTRRTLEFRFTPSEVGSLLLAVETPVQRGELVASNNRVEIPLEVRRDKIRILTISGAPTWNYRFLRLALKRDPVIDLISFVFLRTSDDDPGVPTRELSLVPFPLDKLFLEELKNFDIVVLDNFSAQEYFSNYYLERVGDYVRAGGAFLMFGGRRSFGAGGYARSPIQDLLPVRLTSRADYGVGRRLPGRLTPVGERHPVTRLSTDPKSNADLWNSLPPLRRVNVTQPNGKGQILVTSGEEAGGIPLIAVRRVGEGRVLAVLTDDLWRWNFGMVAAEKTNRLYLQLISQSIRWLVGDPASSQVRILPDAEPGEGGMRIIRTQVLDESFRPAAAARVQVTLRDPYGRIRRLRAVFRPETGEFEARFLPGGAGSYRVEVSARVGEKAIGEAVRTVWVGGTGGAELADVSPRWERLAALADKTGGLFFPAAAGEGEGREGLARRVEEALKGKVPPKLTEVRDVRLWSVPWIGMWLILLPALEWTVRRLWGLA
ncbi:MAG: hypothetical protein V3V62_05625 [bacterium]